MAAYTHVYGPFVETRVASKQEEVIPAARALGVGIVAWAPLGCGLLTGQWTSFEDIPKHDRRRLLRRLNQENFGLVRKPRQVRPASCA